LKLHAKPHVRDSVPTYLRKSSWRLVTQSHLLSHGGLQNPPEDVRRYCIGLFLRKLSPAELIECGHVVCMSGQVRKETQGSSGRGLTSVLWHFCSSRRTFISRFLHSRRRQPGGGYLKSDYMSRVISHTPQPAETAVPRLTGASETLRFGFTSTGVPGNPRYILYCQYKNCSSAQPRSP
jgi:hypothetical protein